MTAASVEIITGPGPTALPRRHTPPPPQTPGGSEPPPQTPDCSKQDQAAIAATSSGSATGDFTRALSKLHHHHARTLPWKGLTALFFTVALILVQGAYTYGKYIHLYRECHGTHDHWTLVYPRTFMGIKLGLLSVDAILTVLALAIHERSQAASLKVEMTAIAFGIGGSYAGAILMLFSARFHEVHQAADFVPGVVVNLAVLVVEFAFFTMAWLDARKLVGSTARPLRSREHRVKHYGYGWVVLLIVSAVIIIILAAAVMGKVKDGKVIPACQATRRLLRLLL